MSTTSLDTNSTEKHITVNDWADEIRPHLASAVEHIVAAGKKLIEAKENLPHGQFGDLCTSLGFTTRTAQRFMAIARHPVLSDATQASHLPASWSTLHELSKVDADDLQGAIEVGRVTPRLDRGDARALVAHIAIERQVAERGGDLVAEQGGDTDLEAAGVPRAPQVDPVDPVLEIVHQVLALLGEILTGLDEAEEDHDILVPLYQKVAEVGRFAEQVAAVRAEEYEAALAEVTP